MGEFVANIIKPVGYPIRFNCPRESRHSIRETHFLPIHKLYPPGEGVFIWPPSFKRTDLIHSFNRIPITGLPFVIGFESFMPRAFGLEGTRWHKFLVDRLLRDNCKALIPYSQFARNQFFNQHAGAPEVLERLKAKTKVFYPSTFIDQTPRATDPDDDVIRIAFVGDHIARKGGLAALRLMKRAHEAGLKLELHIVGAIQYGASVWTDPSRAEFFKEDLELLNLPTVHVHGRRPGGEALARLPNVEVDERIPNRDVIKVMKACDFTWLTTFSDTFGYTSVESLSVGTPLISTDICSLGEFMEDGVNGFVAPMEKKENNEWRHLELAFKNRAGAEYEQVFNQTCGMICDTVFDKLQTVANRRAELEQLRRGARETALEKFDVRKANAFFDDLYDQALA